MKLDFENIFIHLIGYVLILSGCYEAIFDDVSWSVYVPLLFVGIVLIKSPLSKVSNIGLDWLRSIVNKK